MPRGMAGSDGRMDATLIPDWSSRTKWDGMWAGVSQDGGGGGGAGVQHGGVIACSVTGVCGGVTAGACRSEAAGGWGAAGSSRKFEEDGTSMCSPSSCCAAPK